MATYYILDFESTFLRVEALEVLAELALAGQPDAAERLDQIREITRRVAEGTLAYGDSLQARLDLMQARQDHLQALIPRLREEVSVSISRNQTFFETYRDRIYILSHGFREFIEPVVADYGIPPSHVLANTFRTDADGRLIGPDPTHPLAQSGGKARVLAALQLQGEVIVLGDAYTDYEVKAAGVAHKFFAFTENVLRASVLEKADHIVPSFEEFLYVNQLPMALSYPKNRIKVLLLENIHAKAEEIFSAEGYQVETISRALAEDELCEKIKGVHIIGIRSKTRITRKVLEHANRLMVVGAFCIGTNQIDLEACAEHGVVAFNAPYSNTRSVVELAIGEMILLTRRIPEMNHGMHQGTWNKSAKESYEIRGKKLGIIGYGNIGAQLSVLAEAMGMDVYYYDLVEKLALGNATKVNSREELLALADVVTLHVDGRPENRNIFGAEDFARMKPGSIFINLARGFVVDIAALRDALVSGHLRGAAVDVYPKEPKSNEEEFVSELRGLPQVILTPHIGGSTQEAQVNIAQYVPARVIDYINAGSSFGSVNFPNLQLPDQKTGKAHRLIHIHHNQPGILARINQILAQHHINILGQYLKTNETIGYVITDIDKAYDDDVLEDLKQIAETIKFRVLY
ncbi:MAG: phosphoglycerate dehydrogenase [Bacteroidetes bacterium]|nr:MAG: phosphoglycerate dehydrogenase [Bacteroidota bacterium]